MIINGYNYNNKNKKVIDKNVIKYLQTEFLNELRERIDESITDLDEDYSIKLNLSEGSEAIYFKITRKEDDEVWTFTVRNHEQVTNVDDVFYIWKYESSKDLIDDVILKLNNIFNSDIDDIIDKEMNIVINSDKIDIKLEDFIRQYNSLFTTLDDLNELFMTRIVITNLELITNDRWYCEYTSFNGKASTINKNRVRFYSDSGKFEIVSVFSRGSTKLYTISNLNKVSNSSERIETKKKVGAN